MLGQGKKYNFISRLRNLWPAASDSSLRNAENLALPTNHIYTIILHCNNFLEEGWGKPTLLPCKESCMNAVTRTQTQLEDFFIFLITYEEMQFFMQAGTCFTLANFNYKLHKISKVAVMCGFIYTNPDVTHCRHPAMMHVILWAGVFPVAIGTGNWKSLFPLKTCSVHRRQLLIA